MEMPIRVLVANSPRLMRELILTTFLDQPDIEIVGEVESEAGILASVEKNNITQQRLGERPTICDAVLRQWPNMRIIAVAPHDNYSVHYWASLDIHSQGVEASEESILSVLRTKISPICGLT